MSYIMVEYLCTAHENGRFESLERRPAPDTSTCPHCGADAERVISAVPGFAQFVTVERGKIAPPPSPNHLDTSGYGLRKQTWREWKAARAKQHRDRRHKEIKEKL